MAGQPSKGLRLPAAGRLRVGPSAPSAPPPGDARSRREERLDRAQKLEASAGLARALAAWQCPGCDCPDPDIYSTTGRIRHVRCRSCGANGKITAPARPQS